MRRKKKAASVPQTCLQEEGVNSKQQFAIEEETENHVFLRGIRNGKGSTWSPGFRTQFSMLLNPMPFLQTGTVSSGHQRKEADPLWKQKVNLVKKALGKPFEQERVLELGLELNVYKGGFDIMRKNIFKTNGNLEVNLTIVMQIKTLRRSIRTLVSFCICMKLYSEKVCRSRSRKSSAVVATAVTALPISTS